MDDTFEGKWVVEAKDSETSEVVLIDCKTGMIVGRRDKNGNWIQPDQGRGC